MIKKIPFAVGLGVVLWVVFFGIIFLLNIISFFKDKVLVQWIIMWVAILVLTFFASKMYFKKASGNWRDGIVLGIFWCAVISVLDMGITVPFFSKRQIEILWKTKVSYMDAAAYLFSDWHVWVGYGIIIATTLLACLIMKPKRPGSANVIASQSDNIDQIPGSDILPEV